ncbi:hypothetical protein ACIBL6_47570 [Streptomyces sp. NPDC050400]|uniref:hypothetical protein n=1 Tax=Streptomyces sp. NPDC050400 TaxID=3365610 RepID=UPI00378FCEA2
MSEIVAAHLPVTTPATSALDAVARSLMEAVSPRVELPPLGILQQIAPRIADGSFLTTEVRRIASEMRDEYGASLFRDHPGRPELDLEEESSDAAVSALRDLAEPAATMAGETAEGATWRQQRLAAAFLAFSVTGSLLAYALVASDAAKELFDRIGGAATVALWLGSFVYANWEKAAPRPPGATDDDDAN